MANAPVVAIVVGPIELTPTVVAPPFSEKIAVAPVPSVVIEPPRIVVEPPVEVRTAYIWSPCVETEVSVSFATPPLTSLPNGPL